MDQLSEGDSPSCKAKLERGQQDKKGQQIAWTDGVGRQDGAVLQGVKNISLSRPDKCYLLKFTVPNNIWFCYSSIVLQLNVLDKASSLKVP